jgi:O-antigen/teichoic acid export membrane protein
MTVTRRHALRGVAWTMAQRWAVRATTLIVFVILGRLLDPQDFGLVALAGVFVGLLTVFGDFGFATYLVQARAVDQRGISTVFWSGLMLSSVIAIGLAGASPLIAGLFNAPELAPVLAVLSIGIVIHAFSATPSALLKRELAFRTLATRSILATILSSVVSVVLALAGAGVWALVAQALVLNTVSAVVLWLVGRWRPSWCFDRAFARQAMSYGSSVLGIQLVGQLRRRGIDLVIGAVAGTAVLGYWTVATRILAVIFDTVVQAISAVSTPVLARLQEDLPRLRRAYVLAVSTSLALITPVLVALLVTAHDMIVLVFGNQWEPSVPAAQIMSIATLFTTMVYFDRGLMLAVGRERWELFISLGAAVGRLVFVLLVASEGLTAIASACLLQVVVTWPLRLRATSSVLEMPVLPFALTQGRTLLAGAGSAAVALVLETFLPDSTQDLLAVCLGALAVAGTYPAFLWLLNRTALNEVRDLVRRQRPVQPSARDAPKEAPKMENAV